MNKMKKKIKKVESDAVRDKQQQQQRERVADNVVDRHSNQFPNFMALTKEEKLALFESLHAARKNIIDSGNKIKERFGTVHDEYLKYFGSIENEGCESFIDSTETLECSGTYESFSSSLQSESSKSTYSAIPRRTMTKPVETIFIQMNMSTNSFTPSITSSKNYQESKSLLSKENEDREKDGYFGKNPAQLNEIQMESPKRKRPRDDNSYKVKKKSSSRLVTNLPKLKQRENSKAQKEEKKFETSTSNKSRFETLKSNEKEIFISSLKEARESILKESPGKDNETLSMKDTMKKYEKPKEAAPTKIKVASRKETCVKGKANNLRVKVIITSSESGRIKNERVSKKKERSARSEKERVEVEKEKTKKGTAVRVEKDKKSKDTKRKLVRSTDGLRKKQQRQDNSIVSTRRPKENKNENLRAQKKGDPTKRPEEACQDKRNEKERKVLAKREKSVIKNFSGKQEKKKILVSRRKIQKDKPKEKIEKPKKKERCPKSERVEQGRQSVLVEKEIQEEKVAEEIKEDSRSSGEGTAEAIEPPTETAETLKTGAKSIESFYFVNKFKSIEDVKDEGKDKTEETKRRKNEPKHSLSSKSLQNEFGKEIENVDNKGVTLSMETTGEEITIEAKEEISVTKRPLPESRSLIRELRLEEEGLDDCPTRKASSHLVTSDEVSVLQLWEELKLLKLSDSDCVMETESMTAQMGSENISESRFTFPSKKNFQNKVHLAQENLIVVGNENTIRDKGRKRREAAVLDLLKSEGVIVVDGDAIEKIKNLVEALEKEAEMKRTMKLNVKPDKENLENEYSQLLFEYIDYLTRLLYMLTNEREQKPQTLVSAPLIAAGSHHEFLGNKTKKSESVEKPRSLSDTNLPEDTKFKVEIKVKESTPQDSEAEGDPRCLLPFSDSPITVSSSSEDDVSLVTTPDSRKKLIEDFLRERAKFVEENIDGFRIIKMASRGCEILQMRQEERKRRRSSSKKTTANERKGRPLGGVQGPKLWEQQCSPGAIIVMSSNMKNFLDTEDLRLANPIVQNSCDLLSSPFPYNMFSNRCYYCPM